jgi:transcriptional regulator with XRE-family HTH domain
MRRPRNEHLQARLHAFGEAVRLRRKAEGLSQEQLADKAGLHRTYIGSVERGERNVSLGNLYALADALRTSPDQLLGVASEDSTPP